MSGRDLERVPERQPALRLPDGMGAVEATRVVQGVFAFVQGIQMAVAGLEPLMRFLERRDARTRTLEIVPPPVAEPVEPEHAYELADWMA